MSESRKRNKSYYKGKFGSKKGRYNNDIRPKLKGFIITCGGQERSATLEGYKLLNEYADKKYGPEKIEGMESDNENDDIDATLSEQISSIKAAAKSDERRFQSVQNKAKNVIFIKTTLDNPVDLVSDIFEDLLTSGLPKTQHCCKLLPVVDTCYAKVNHIVEAARPLFHKFFTESNQDFTYCIMWKARCNNTIKRDDVYPELIKIIQEVEVNQKVSYTNPDVSINLDIIGNICCIGFLWNYHKYAKYNLDAVCKINKKSTPAPDNKSKSESKEENTSSENIIDQNLVTTDQKLVDDDSEVKDASVNIENKVVVEDTNNGEGKDELIKTIEQNEQ